ncbi:peptidase M24 family protein (homolog to ectoine hydrolase) (plasmid) [Natrialba magadii ATCC 43099]|uniref:Creatinase n=1 Tax=Natrialba magadii (strain ATCC 43099 / DSM 3394 / CCM 3739 / CIP 104546 / IAM 13178 / JCM 8861 / NBRC 102185 / NCIMB 2190 / MS3) TaxID=547559 RepID=D3T143_NATMM|nr:M24 family metallopeptidase [Natrialba magadii]ADD07302.1 peptidase M24 family protein (homolog to ectoine hydrolase) [Natrialba magadii ATCC 43099]ELY32730.1 creatinase [Natrialba magadii ATCC 43099]
MSRDIFDDAEYERRLDRTKTRLREENLDAIVVTDPANMNYLTGYDGWSFYVHQAVVVTTDRDEPVWVGRGMDADGARATTSLSEESIRAYSDDHVHSPYDLHPMDYVAGVLEELDVAEGRIGLEMDAAYFTAKSYTRLQQNLPDADFEDTTLLVGWVRVKKSDQELEYMREAAQISETAMQAGLDAIEAGVPEYEAAAAIYDALISGTDEFGGDYPSIVPLMPSGDHTGTPHLTWTDRPFEEGDPVIIELSGCRHRYHSPLARTTFVGEPPAELERTAEIVNEGIQAALDVAEPGVTCEDVEKAWRETIAKYDIEKEDRIGYSVGLGYPPDWGEHTASIRPGDETVLEENMTFHMIPGIWTEDIGMETSETFRVTSNGVETLADFPRKLFTA